MRFLKPREQLFEYPLTSVMVKGAMNDHRRRAAGTRGRIPSSMSFIKMLVLRCDGRDNKEIKIKEENGNVPGFGRAAPGGSVIGEQGMRYSWGSMRGYKITFTLFTVYIVRVEPY